MNVLKIPFGLSSREILGGPFKDCPRNATGVFSVKLAPEVPGVASVIIPIKDFGVPDDPRVVANALESVIRSLSNKNTVYVGCMGGRGRTGLFLALLVKAMGIPEPVEYVREHYLEEAVETEAQYTYVMDFNVSFLKPMVSAAKWHAGVVDFWGLFGIKYGY